MKRKDLTEINAGSMADIAFLLLIFFLVTTTMSTNTGLQRKLPPITDDPPPDVLERNVMLVRVNREDIIAIGGLPISLNDLTKRTKEFFTNPEKKENLSEYRIKNIDFLGDFPVSKGLVSLQTDRNTSFRKYLQVQNELVRAVNELRNDLSLTKFNMPFEDLSKDKKDAVSEAYPLAISEAEPRRIKTNN